MSLNHQIKTIDARDIVKEYAEFYRSSEEERQRKEDVTHLVANHPELKPVIDIIQAMAT
jgi:hypothetical protein